LPAEKTGLPPKNPARPSSHRPLRPRDSMGALAPTQANLDAAHARGYAEGVEETREQALDDLRTILSRILEKRFGELDEPALEYIAEADELMLKKWIVLSIDIDVLDSLFAE
jgi:hypothetical protein